MDEATPADGLALSREEMTSIALNDLPAAGLPALVWSDGPNGIRDAEGATAFPSQLALAASFDRELARSYGRAVARECRAAGRNAFLGPGLDIARVPWAGRLSETLGEDTELVSSLGVEIVRGVQSGEVLAVPKHFVANNFETMRTGRGSFSRRTDAIDVWVDPEVLRDVYAEPFRRALLHGGSGAILTSYNRLGGEYTSQSAAVFAILRDEWGWGGLVVPDFIFAVRDDEAALSAGLDVPALGGAAGRTREMVDRLPVEALDRLARHVTHGIRIAGVTDASPASLPLDDTASQELAQDMLERGAVLLKNSGVLPIGPSARSVVVIGTDMPLHLLVTGGSAAVEVASARSASLAAALASATDLDVRSVAGGCDDLPAPSLGVATEVTFKDQLSGETVAQRRESFEVLDVPDGIGPDWEADATATYVPSASGRHRVSLTFGGEAALYVNGARVAQGAREAARMIGGPEYPLHAVVELEQGVPVEMRVRYETGSAISVPGLIVPGFRLGVVEHGKTIRAAAAAATDADVAVVVAGRVSGEAMDVESIRLPADQDSLIEAVAAANPNTVVVTCGAGPIAMPWLDSVAGVLHAWTPGERFGAAIARLLAGVVEPTGRLPMTFPMDDAATPVSEKERYPGENGVVRYTEGDLVGYRWYEAVAVEPLFEFGFGLGYSHHHIELAEVRVSPTSLHARVLVANVSETDGTAVVQLYCTSPDDMAPALKAFARVSVAAGERESVDLDIPLRALAKFTMKSGRYEIRGGEYLVSVGASSRDLPARSVVVIQPGSFASDFRP